MNQQSEPEPQNPGNSAADYDASDIRHLEGIAGIRHRPAMYIGDTTTRGLHHLVFEIVDNSVDEAVNGHATTVHVQINGDGSVTCADDGRGIPVGTMPDMDNRSALEVVLTEIHAGGKFDRESGYKTGTGGLHGVGITAVNALSEWLEAEIRREGHVWTMSFIRGVINAPLKKLGTTDHTGTRITFKADASIFPDTKYQYDVLHKRLQELAFLTPGLRIHIADERTGQSDEFHYEQGIIEFVRHLNRTENPLYSDVISIEGEQEGTQVSIALQHNDGFSENCRAFANNIYNVEGGTHMSGFRSALTRTINAYGKRENIFKDNTPTGDDYREGLTAVVTVRVPDPQFEGQTKTRLGNSEVEGIVTSIVNEKLARFFEENPQTAKVICQKGLNASEAREAARKAREMVRLDKKTTTGGLPEKLRDCRTHDLDVSELYLVEGDSAGGSADTGRDSNTQAILPLRGKILNVEKAQLVKVLGNAEVANIFRAIGIPPGAELEDVAKRRYGKVIVMTDADVDGSHIRTLLLTFIFRHMRKLVEEGCVYIAQPPLYRVEKKNAKKSDKPRYVQAHEQMMAELVELGMDGSSLRAEEDGTVFADEHFQRLLTLIGELEEPLETLERRGIDLRYLAHNIVGEDGMLPRYRVFLGRDQHWFVNKEGLDQFLAEEESRRGHELKVADEQALTPPDAATDHEAEAALQVIDLHEVRTINHTLQELRSYGVTLENLIPAGNRNGEPWYPFTILNDDGNQRLASLRELLPSIRKMGEKGLKLTRFKGLGEMNPDELFETSMDVESRVLLQVTMQDAAAADEIFRVLMGDHVEPRREFIEKHALEVRDLDV